MKYLNTFLEHIHFVIFQLNNHILRQTRKSRPKGSILTLFVGRFHAHFAENLAIIHRSAQANPSFSIEPNFQYRRQITEGRSARIPLWKACNVWQMVVQWMRHGDKQVWNNWYALKRFEEIMSWFRLLLAESLGVKMHSFIEAPVWTVTLSIICEMSLQMRHTSVTKWRGIPRQVQPHQIKAGNINQETVDNFPNDSYETSNWKLRGSDCEWDLGWSFVVISR
jgi:hypothetical protein